MTHLDGPATQDDWCVRLGLEWTRDVSGLGEAGKGLGDQAK